MKNPNFFLFRILYLIIIRTIDPSFFRLFAVYRSIARILHLNTAGDYINRILEDLDKINIKTNEFTELEYFIKLKLNEWWDKIVRAY
jgi:hypothetical protein